TDTRTDADAQIRVVVVRREDVVVALPRVMQDRNDIRPGFALPCKDDRSVRDRVDRRARRVVELDALMLLEVAAHGRAVAVRLVDVGIGVRVRDGAAQPGAARCRGRARLLCVDERGGWRLARDDARDAHARRTERPVRPAAPCYGPHVAGRPVPLSRGEVVDTEPVRIARCDQPEWRRDRGQHGWRRARYGARGPGQPGEAGQAYLGLDETAFLERVDVDLRLVDEPDGRIAVRGDPADACGRHALGRADVLPREATIARDRHAGQRAHTHLSVVADVDREHVLVRQRCDPLAAAAVLAAHTARRTVARDHTAPRGSAIPRDA